MTLKEKLKRLRDAQDNILLVHYSCQSLNDSNEGFSARISSIAVTHFVTSVTNSFSIHLVAERRKIKKEDIVAHYDVLEAELLTNFYDFMRQRLQHFWVHWNMSNSVFGFEALAHRYSVLTQNEAPVLDDEKKFNLIELVSAKYGKRSVDDPKMKNLMILNGGLHRDWLDGKQESECFTNREFVRLHKSTITKTYFFGSILGRLLFGKRLKTNHDNWKERVEMTLEHPIAKVLGLIAVLFTIYTTIVFIVGQTKEKPNQTSEPTAASGRGSP